MTKANAAMPKLEGALDNSPDLQVRNGLFGFFDNWVRAESKVLAKILRDGFLIHRPLLTRAGN